MIDDRRPLPAADEEEATLAALAPFFAAARDDPPEPPLALMSAILGDAAELSAGRRVAAPAPGPARPGWRLGLGGWRAGSALAACALLGFWLGLAGTVTIDGVTLEAGAATAADADPVAEFLDLASVE